MEVVEAKAQPKLTQEEIRKALEQGDKLIRRRGVEDMLDCSSMQIYRYIEAGILPPGMTVAGGRTRFWLRSQVAAAAARVVQLG